MSLQQFVKTNRNLFSDKYQAQFAADNNRSLLVWVNEYKTGLKTKHHQDGTGEGIIVDVWDLTAQSQGQPAVFCNVLWMGGAVRDQLKPYVGSGQPLPIRLTKVTPDGGGPAYITPNALDGEWLTYATQMYEAYPTYVADEKARKIAEWEAQQAEQPQPPGVAPAAQQSIPALAGPAPQAQAPAPAPQAAPAPAPAAPAAVAAPAAPAAVAAPVAAPAPAPAAPVAAPAAPVAAPAAPPAAPVAPAAPQAPVAVPAGAPAPVGDTDVSQLISELDS